MRAGFTLVEMVIVVSILGLLLGIGAQRASLSLERSRDAEVMSRLHHLRTAVHQYALDHQGVLPPDLGSLKNVYVKNFNEVWVGGRSRGVFQYVPESGSITLFRADAGGPETARDSRGKPYAEY